MYICCATVCILENTAYITSVTLRTRDHIYFSCRGIPMTPCSKCAVRFFTLAKNDPNCVLQQTLPTEVLTAVRYFIAATSQWKDCKVEQSPKILMIMLCSTFGPGFQNYFLHGYLPGYYPYPTSFVRSLRISYPYPGMGYAFVKLPGGVLWLLDIIPYPKSSGSSVRLP